MNYEEIIKAFQEINGRDLAALIPNDGSNELDKVKRFIDLQAEILTLYIRRYNKSFKLENCNNKQIQALNRILARQMLFACENGTPETVSGVDLNTNSFISPDKIIMAHISPLAIAELKSEGFLYRAIYY